MLHIVRTVDAFSDVFGLPVCTDEDQSVNDTLLVKSAHLLAPFKPVLIGGMRVLEHGYVIPSIRHIGSVRCLFDIWMVVGMVECLLLGGPPWLIK